MMAPKKTEQTSIEQKATITSLPMEDVIHNCIMPYAEYVIMERALPRVEDGLKPVQRRILYTMLELGLTPDKPHRKSARIVGDTLGKYHPHGDTSVYDAMVRMAQDFNMRAPLVDGHGNFGSIDGDSAAAMRYTEVRLSPISLELLRDIEKDTVDFSLNFDDTMKEPDVLPGRSPNLLVNGASGIAVGFATNIPPHNLGEVIDGVAAYIRNPKIKLDEMLQIIKGPDFPTGAYLIDEGELRRAYETGRGRVFIRARTRIEKSANGKQSIVITEMPYQVNKASTLEKILKLSEEKKGVLTGIADIRDESDRDGMRAVIEVRRDADPNKILNYLLKYSDLQTTFGINMVVIADGKPQLMGLMDIIAYYVAYQKNVVMRRTKYDLETAQKREHILEGLMIAVSNIDEAIRIIRRSRDPKEAKEKLIERFKLSELQAQAILDMRLQRLTGLEIEKLKAEYEEVKQLIVKLRAILASEGRLMRVILDELAEIKLKHAKARKTSMLAAPPRIEIVEEKPEI
ncbi:MAG: DNA topoisomerase (ATP-hydrolyzing), partial [Bacillota bacterium]|nr:DNA topoisomerase (ATP-hydrolyzing) [Bacillota bacterium]